MFCKPQVAFYLIFAVESVFLGGQLFTFCMQAVGLKAILSESPESQDFTRKLKLFAGIQMVLALCQTFSVVCLALGHIKKQVLPWLLYILWCFLFHLIICPGILGHFIASWTWDEESSLRDEESSLRDEESSFMDEESSLSLPSDYFYLLIGLLVVQSAVAVWSVFVIFRGILEFRRETKFDLILRDEAELKE